ncbi:unnamed protein product [Calicophoron daubneyi]|uniref:Rab-GAP TBC domain-containing protein n=1 Tax=Calicophoron daubneyi TaxID=300641 RepID=A0AAV2TEY9_CALDB
MVVATSPLPSRKSWRPSQVSMSSSSMSLCNADTPSATVANAVSQNSQMTRAFTASNSLHIMNHHLSESADIANSRESLITDLHPRYSEYEDAQDYNSSSNYGAPQPLIVSTTVPVPDKLKFFNVSPSLFSSSVSTSPRMTRHLSAQSSFGTTGCDLVPCSEDAAILDFNSVQTQKSPVHKPDSPLVCNDVKNEGKSKSANEIDTAALMKSMEDSGCTCNSPPSGFCDSSRTSGISTQRTSKTSSSSQSSGIRTEDALLWQHTDGEVLGIKELQEQLEKSLEREACLQQMLHHREARMAELDQRISLMEDTDDRHCELSIPDGASCATLRQMLKEMEKKRRCLNNKIQFLITEVRDLSMVRQMLTDHGAKQARYTKRLTADLLKWKQDYVKLLESCIGAVQADIAQSLLLSDYGRKKCQARINELLDEARRKDPTLPSLKKPKGIAYHVDFYGFKQNYNDDLGLIHYVCRHLREFFVRQMVGEDETIQQWNDVLRQPNRELTRAELKYLCRAGVPTQYRRGVWRMLIHGELKQMMAEKGPHYYNRLVAEISESTVATTYRKQISLDLLRTMPNNVEFDSPDASGIQQLQELLQAYSIHNPEIGYCQGMNFLAAVALTILKKEDAFWCLTAILEKYLPTKYFNCGLINAQVDQLVLKDLLSSKLPRLAEHIQRMDIDISAITLNWFLALFYDSVPFETLLRIWDIFLVEGSKCLFRFALALLKRNEDMLMLQTDTISFWKCLKSASRLTYDAQSLIVTAYEELHPFAARSVISNLQNNHYEILNREMSEKRRLWENVVKEVAEEHMDESPAVMQRRTKSERQCIQTATCLKNGKIWLCYGAKSQAVISELTMNDNQMANAGIELDACVTCLSVLNDDIVLIGTFGCKLMAYSVHSKEQLWILTVHDSVTEIEVVHWEEDNANKVFAGLSNGELLVMENVGEKEPKDSVYNLIIGFTRISSLLLVDHQIWCACGNTVYIFHASTLDYQGQFSVSNSALDLILTMKTGSYGVWIAVRGSSVIELWNPKTLNRMLLFDTFTDTCVTRREEEEGTFNLHRVTAILPYESTLWVGTGSGEIVVFEIRDSEADNQFEFQEVQPLENSLINLSLNSQQTCPDKLTAPAEAGAENNNKVPSRVNEKTTLGSSCAAIQDVGIYDCVDNSQESACSIGLGEEALTMNRKTARSQSLPSTAQNIDPLGIELMETAEKLLEEYGRAQTIKVSEQTIQKEIESHCDDSDHDKVESDKSRSKATEGGPENQLTGHDKFDSTSSYGSFNIRDSVDIESDTTSPVLLNTNAVFYPLRHNPKAVENSDAPNSRFQMIPIARNKVSETPIRLFIMQRKAGGETVIVSCATFFNDDDAVLKWHRLQKESLIWTNQPILFYDSESHQVQIPSYMMNTVRMRREGKRRITVAT